MKVLNTIVVVALCALVALVCFAAGYRIGIDNAPQDELVLRWDTPVYQEGRGISHDGLILGEEYVRPLWEVNNETAEVLELSVRLGYIEQGILMVLSDPEMRQSIIDHGISEEEIAFVEGKLK